MFGVHVLTLATVARVTQCLCHHYRVVHTTLRINPKVCKYVIINLFLEMEFRCINMKDHWTITNAIILPSTSHFFYNLTFLHWFFKIIKTSFVTQKQMTNYFSFKVSTLGWNYNNLHISYLHIIQCDKVSVKLCPQYPLDHLNIIYLISNLNIQFLLIIL